MRYEWKYGPAVVKTEDNLDNVVIEVNWSCIGYADNGNIYKKTGSIDSPPVDPDHYVPFDQLTRQEIEQWVFAVVDKQQVENALLAESQAESNIKPFDF